jgi:hypothetical protein
MIAWKYIDKQSATIAAIRDYKSMRTIINNTPEEIKTLYDRMVSPQSSRITGTPRSKNPRAGEDAIVKSLDKLDAMQERYRQAIEYMSWFESAWGTMTDEEQLVLSEFYSDNGRSGASARLQVKLNYGSASVERLRAKALTRLTLLLFGR